jgi:hypothetical protein
MCKEIPVIPINRVVDKRIVDDQKKWRAERHKGSLAPKREYEYL